tara:strand:+ start:7173 stop:7913 length:741 start_codon:yes stop_codon:yes gene_type:complete
MAKRKEDKERQRSKMRDNVRMYGQRGAGKSSLNKPSPTMDFDLGEFNPLDEEALGDFDEYGPRYDYGEQIRSGGSIDPEGILAEFLAGDLEADQPSADFASPEVRKKLANYIMSVGIDEEGVEHFANPYKLNKMKAREKDRLKYNPSWDERPSLNTNFEDWSGHYMNVPGTIYQLLSILSEKINEYTGGDWEGEYANPRRDKAEKSRGLLSADQREEETPMYQEDWYSPNVGRLLDYSPTDPRRKK